MPWRSSTSLVEALVTFIVIWAHIFSTPFTKVRFCFIPLQFSNGHFLSFSASNRRNEQVEESFNVQASYDLIYKSWADISNFDHLHFPGVVPRTFIGPIVLALISYVPKALLALSPHATLHIVRAVLGALVALSLLCIRAAVAARFSAFTATLFTLVSLSQFHIPFYASRPLPNVFALVFTNVAFAQRIRSTTVSEYRAIVLLAVACALLRSELALYLFPTIVAASLVRSIRFYPACGLALASAVTTALSSITVDSYFWQRLAYPELEVFYFNVVLNKSAAWGTLPFHWYFSNALPRALGGMFPLALLALLRFPRLLLPLAGPTLFFISAYSVLPHKELRFIFYTLPVLNACAAVCTAAALRDLRTAWLSASMRKTRTASARRAAFRSLLPALCIVLIAVISLAASVAQSVISTVASRHNYPSAHALRHMHVVEEDMYNDLFVCVPTKDTALSHSADHIMTALVHIDVDSAMNGISQFVYRPSHASTCPQWHYSKDESVTDKDFAKFTHIVSARKRVQGFCVVLKERAFIGLDWRKGLVRLTEHTYVHRNMNISTQACLPS